ncbi:MAG: GTPase HflX [Clostridia bacterium]|nr:GTPase HflX [Clostridia bacterium]
MNTEYSLGEPGDHGGEDGRERAILVGLDAAALSGWDVDESMDELERLLETAGGRVVARVTQRKQKPDPGYYIGVGKAKEIEALCSATGADLVVVDDELTPAQQRNLEETAKVRVIDRTQLILDIFAQRAATSEGKLQVELAQLQYALPRLTGHGVELSRLGGGIGTRGPGETKLEVDRRTTRSRIAAVKREIDDVRQRRGVQRQRRRDAELPVVALIGYTNAGKSSLLNALTGSDVLVEDKLFATLDPTTRRYTMPSGQAVLLTDTVGFIQKLPHHLIVAFRATLEEVVEADLLLHVVDAGHPKAVEHCSAVFGVLDEIGAADHPVITVLNKCDLPESAPTIDRLRHSYPVSVAVSAHTGEGASQLAQMISDELSGRWIRIDTVLSYNDPMMALIKRKGRVISEEFREDGVALVAEVDRAVAGQLRKMKSNGAKNVKPVPE